MKGKIKMFNEEKGFGFVLGENSKDFFFHISEIKSLASVQRGDIVEFIPTENIKGLVAKEIQVLESVAHKNFVSFGTVRIKSSNIQSYGIYEKTEENSLEKLERERYETELRLHKELWDLHQTQLDVIRVQGGSINRSAAESSWREKNPEPIVPKTVKLGTYLCVTTYQKETYCFWKDEVEFDIYEKLKELDELLS